MYHLRRSHLSQMQQGRKRFRFPSPHHSSNTQTHSKIALRLEQPCEPMQKTRLKVSQKQGQNECPMFSRLSQIGRQKHLHSSHTREASCEISAQTTQTR